MLNTTPTQLLVLPILFGLALAILLAFPDAVPSLQKRPLYLQDIVVEDESLVSSSSLELWKRKRTYYRACRLMVNLSTAALIAGFAEYGYALWDQKDKPTSYMEVCGVVGGVLALMNRAQSVASRVLLKLCHLAQAWDERRRAMAEMSLHVMSSPPLNPTPVVHSDQELNTFFLGVV